jgi:hypothetical protein
MAKDEAEKVAPTKPRFPLIKPQHVEIDAGLFFRRVQIKLPKPVGEETAIKPVDLHEYPTELWSKVQMDRNKPLRRFDEVRIIAHDESWIINNALVMDADDKKVQFAKYVTIELAVPDQVWSDDDVTIAYDGAMKYVVRSKRTGAVLMSGFDKLEIAQSEYIRSLGKRVA